MTKSIGSRITVRFLGVKSYPPCSRTRSDFEERPRKIAERRLCDDELLDGNGNEAMRAPSGGEILLKRIAFLDRVVNMPVEFAIGIRLGRARKRIERLRHGSPASRASQEIPEARRLHFLHELPHAGNGEKHILSDHFWFWETRR